MARDQFHITVHDDKHIECQAPGELSPREYSRGAQERSAFELARRTLILFNSWLSDAIASDRDAMTVIGSHLYGLLFPGKIDEVFRNLLKKREADQPADPLRIVLEFRQEAEWMAALPWEFLYLPDIPGEKEGFFLSVNNDLILTRSVKLAGAAPTKKDQSGVEPIRILVVLSEPYGENSVSEDGLIELRDIVNKNKTKFQLREYIRVGSGMAATRGPTRADFKKYVNDKDFVPDIVHFLGHGNYDRLKRDERRESGRIALVDGGDQTPGEADWCPDKEFADLFDQKHLPQLVFLHCCEGGKTLGYRGFKGVALSLVHRGIQNVVAMQYPVENAVANKFAATFYREVLEHGMIDVAVQAGRKALGLELFELSKKQGREGEHFSDRRFGSPIAYIQSYHGLAIVGKQEYAADVQCPYNGCGGKHSPERHKFCPKGYGRLVLCASCRTFNQDGERVCGNCGNKLVAAVTEEPMPGQTPAPVSVPSNAADRFRAAAETNAGQATPAAGATRPWST